MCTHPFAKEALTLHLARSEGHERYFGCNLMHRKVLASSHQHLMAEAPDFGAYRARRVQKHKRTQDRLAGTHVAWNPCSPSPESMFTIPGIRVHDALEWMFTFGWNLRSRCPGIRSTVCGRTLNYGERDNGEAILVEPGDTLIFPQGSVKVMLADVDRYSEPESDGYARMCPEVRGKRTAPSTPSSEYQIRRQPPRVRELRSDVGSRRCVVVESGQRR